jgi:hypothetical protein
MFSTNFEAVSKAGFCKVCSNPPVSLFEDFLQNMSEDIDRGCDVRSLIKVQAVD